MILVLIKTWSLLYFHWVALQRCLWVLSAADGDICCLQVLLVCFYFPGVNGLIGRAV